MREPSAGDGGAVAELGGQRLDKSLAADVVIKNLVYDLTDILENVAAPDKLLIVSSGRCDLKVITPTGIELRIDPVEGERDNGQHVGLNGGGLPGGIDLTGGHILDVIREGYRYIFGPLIGRSQMHGNGAWYVRDDGTAIAAISQILARNIPDAVLQQTGLALGEGLQLHILESLYPVKNLDALYQQHGIARGALPKRHRWRRGEAARRGVYFPRAGA